MLVADVLFNYDSYLIVKTNRCNEDKIAVFSYATDMPGAVYFKVLEDKL
jgi:hypothetical protein